MTNNTNAPTEWVTVPAGWKLVPVEPTLEMIRAGFFGEEAARIYRFMLAAAPTYGVAQGGVK